MTSQPTDEQLDRIKSQIRADSDIARERAPLPQRASPSGDLSGTVASDVASIAALSRHAGPAFVEHAYRAILRRPPDDDGYARQMALLASGAGKIEMLGDLRYSTEGRRVGTPIAGLKPRYLLAKLTRVPVLGALLQWLIGVVSLPHLLRHQRMTEASLAVRFGETAARFGETTVALHAAEHRDAQLRDAIDAQAFNLAHAVEALSARLTNAETFTRELLPRIEHLEQPNPQIIELRQLVLTMNHWTVEVRKSIDAIAASEAERRLRNDETSAAIIVHARARDAQRKARFDAWIDELAPRLPRDAVVLDLCGDADLVAAMSARGWRTSSIESNSALHRAARARGLDVTLGAASTLLPRTGDGSLDALIASSPQRIDVNLPLVELLRETHRLLKSGGTLLIGTAETRHDLAMPDILRGAGFTDPKMLDACAATVVFATRS